MPLPSPFTPLAFSFHCRLGTISPQTIVCTQTKGRCIMERASPKVLEKGFFSQRRQWHPTPVLLLGKIPWTEEPGRLQSMGSLRVRHDRATSLSLFTFMRGKGNDNPLQCACLENPRDGGAWWAAVYGVAQSRTRLKRLSSSSSSNLVLSVTL